ncbi:MAG: LPP20 family lipoprotein [Bacteroidota bacterium]
MMVKNYNSQLLLLLMGSVLFAFMYGCSTTAEAQNADLPAWVDDPSKQFSDDQFLMAVGSSPSREGARNQAQANLAQRFVSDVEVEESYVNEFEEITDSEEGTTTRENTNLITTSEVGSNQQMKNVQIKEVHEAPDGTFYALAVMDRMETSRLYSEEIENNRQRIKSLRNKTSETSSKLDKLIFAKQALTAAQVNDMLINQRAILTGQGAGAEEDLLTITMQEYQQAQRECTVKLMGEDTPREVLSTLSRQFQNEGFTMAADAEDPIIEMKVDVTMKPVDLNRPDAEFIQWALQLEAQNKETGQWFSTYTAEGREGSMNEEYARQRAIQAVGEKLKDEFPHFVNEELLSAE